MVANVPPSFNTSSGPAEVVIVMAPDIVLAPVAESVENDPSAGVVPPTMPSKVPALMSAVVATKLEMVPTLVRLEAVTTLASVPPVSVPAGAVTVTEPPAVMVA